MTSLPQALVNVLVSVAVSNLVLTVTLNSLVIVILHRQKDLNDVSKFLYHVSASLDLAMGIAWNPWMIQWVAFGTEENCRRFTSVFVYLHRTIAICILFTVCFVSLDRYFRITKPLHYPMLVTRRRAGIGLAVAFPIIALMCTIHIPFPWFHILADVIINNCINQSIPFWTGTWANRFTTVFIVTPIFATMVILTITNLALLRIARQQSRAIAAIGRRDFPERPRTLFRGIGTVVLLTFPFYVCWLPWIMYLVFQEFLGALDPLEMFGAAASWIRPIIYIATTREARSILRKRSCKQSF
ncbi:histamine H2 receptor-like [Diadema antillarum]|uniref:histamine H2 receptor-like n=1 Tax=Diadema antillarum TaxID=105358 RepID=UPI003A862134